MHGVHLLLALPLLLAPPSARAEAQAQPHATPCFAYRDVAGQLKATYEEAPVSLGLQANGNLLQVFSSAKRGTWTIVSTTPDGQACILAAGRDWENARPTRSDEAA